jgi:hypothetical protein
VRKSIARVLTVISQKQREALKEAYAGKVRGVCVLLLLLGLAAAFAAADMCCPVCFLLLLLLRAGQL